MTYSRAVELKRYETHGVARVPIRDLGLTDVLTFGDVGELLLEEFSSISPVRYAWHNRNRGNENHHHKSPSMINIASEKASNVPGRSTEFNKGAESLEVRVVPTHNLNGSISGYTYRLIPKYSK